MHKWAMPLVVLAIAHSATLPWTITQTSNFDYFYLGSPLDAPGARSYYGPTAVTANGDVYLALPPPQSMPPTKRYGDVSKASIILLKVNASGSTVYLSQIGGILNVAALDTDAEGNVYLVGSAHPAGLPVTRGPATASQESPAYVCALRREGDLAFCQYLDGGWGSIFGAVFDRAGNLYIGASRSAMSPPISTTPGALSIGDRQIVVVKLGPRLREPRRNEPLRVVYAAASGGSRDEFPQSMALGPDGIVYVSGATFSSDFPVTPDAAVDRSDPVPTERNRAHLRVVRESQ